ncbi:DUF5810 domain-containing protein [Halovenus sp. HT40]|uniref:DUF5810 domain-containing protein n=1 Tax=Halovenus sp. HT40 TaxID=3126691 RepID=UPI00300E9057
MGYSCPVCEDPQADGVHLANHLAITAMTRGGDHEAFLDEYVPNWQELDEQSLAEKLQGSAEETEYPQVFEDTTGGHDHDHDHTGSPQRGGGSPTDSIPFEADMPDEPSEDDAEEIMEEAMELTRKRRENTGSAEDGENDEGETE